MNYGLWVFSEVRFLPNTGQLWPMLPNLGRSCLIGTPGPFLVLIQPNAQGSGSSAAQYEILKMNVGQAIGLGLVVWQIAKKSTSAVAARFDYRIRSIERTDVDLVQTTMLVRVEVDNKTKVAVNAVKFTGIVSHGNKRIGAINTDAALELKANSTTLIGLRFAVDNGRFLQRLSDILDGSGSIGDPFRMDGKLQLDSGLNVPIRGQMKIIATQ